MTARADGDGCVGANGLSLSCSKASSITLCFVHELSDFLNLLYQFIINFNAYRLLCRHQGSRAA